MEVRHLLIKSEPCNCAGFCLVFIRLNEPRKTRLLFRRHLRRSSPLLEWLFLMNRPTFNDVVLTLYRLKTIYGYFCSCDWTLCSEHSGLTNRTTGRHVSYAAQRRMIVISCYYAPLSRCHPSLFTIIWERWANVKQMLQSSSQWAASWHQVAIDTCICTAPACEGLAQLFYRCHKGRFSPVAALWKLALRQNPQGPSTSDLFKYQVSVKMQLCSCVL